MGNRLLAYLLITALVSSNFSRLFIYSGFELNKNYIATKLCENRDKPWMHCNGHCYFMKKIKQARDRENSEERQAQKNLFQEAIFPAKSEIKFHALLMQVMFIHDNSLALPTTNTSVFRPPQIG